ncbi:MAG: hypothetical protein R3B45_16385 [Bdellovibrionota bacterium]
MKPTPIRHVWNDINSLLRTHKLINFSLLIICLIQLIIIILINFEDPIVVIKENQKQYYQMGHREDIPLSEEVVRDVVERFLRLRYEWSDLDPKSIETSLSPLVTKGLKGKLYQVLSHLKENEFQGKKTSQSIVNLEIQVTKENIIASFDKLLRIENIPIPVPTTVSLSIIRESPNYWNPTGLMVNGLIEHQSK